MQLPPKPPRSLLILHCEPNARAGCGCPPGGAGCPPGGLRLCDLADLRVQSAHGQVASGALQRSRPLRLAFALPHHNITGGMKMLCEQIRLLRLRGHHVTALFGGAAPRAMPPWTDVEADADVVVAPQQPLAEAHDLTSVDAVVLGIYHQVAEVLGSTPAAVLYWEQVGSEQLHDLGRAGKDDEQRQCTQFAWWCP